MPVTARYEIRDEGGQLIAVHCRTDYDDGRPKRLWWEREGKNGLRGLKSTALPLYGVEALAQRPDGSLVVVTEGEKAREAVRAQGFTAVATVNGAPGIPDRSALQALCRLQVVLWPDNDEPGRRHMKGIGTRLLGMGASDVRTADWCDAPPKGDAHDYVAAMGEDGAGLMEALLREAEPLGPEERPDAGEGGGNGDRNQHTSPGGEPAAQRLVSMVRDRPGVELLRHEGESFITVPVDGHRETYSLLGPDFADWLTYLYYEASGGRSAPASALSDASRTLSAHARYQGPEVAIHRRVGSENDRLYIDLGDAGWNAVVIGPDGWVVSPHPVRFVRSASMKPLPVPRSGGDFSDLWRFVNAGDGAEGAANRSLIAAWLAHAMRADGPFPLLVLHGEQSSAKTFAAKCLRSLVDPSKSLVRARPTNDRDLMIGTRHNHILVFDNVSYLNAAMSDALCQLSTGGGYATRQLHTDYEEAVIDAVRPVILTGINELASQSDLLSRCLPVELPRIAVKKPEAALWREFEESRPWLLGALCDALAIGLRRLPDIVALTDSRFPDFERWAQATETALGMPGGSFVSAYAGAQAQADDLALEASPIASILRAFLSARDGFWVGPATQLHSELEQFDPSARTRPRWPRAGNVLGKELKRLAPNLRKAGIDASLAHSRERVWTLRYADGPPPAVAAVAAVGPSSNGAPAWCGDVVAATADSPAATARGVAPPLPAATAATACDAMD